MNVQSGGRTTLDETNRLGHHPTRMDSFSMGHFRTGHAGRDIPILWRDRPGKAEGSGTLIRRGISGALHLPPLWHGLSKPESTDGHGWTA